MTAEDVLSSAIKAMATAQDHLDHIASGLDGDQHRQHRQIARSLCEQQGVLAAAATGLRFLLMVSSAGPKR